MPHILVMSATPIPRTLAIILYGDLDISVIDELPSNRLPIKNCVVDTGYRNTAYRFMQKQVEAGRQCYVICPIVEESENLEAENVIDYTELLREALGDRIEISFLHGKMKQAEKDEIMEAFGKNEIQILVSTTVIEVGIDVPNATVMLIENAERFGLAQLHQLRGRVGRGKYQSYCIFMSASKSKETKERLEILNKSNDGFFIASEDLRLKMCIRDRFKNVVITTAVAGLHVLILVLSTDLGAALIMFVVYLVMLYVATRQPLYALAGIGGGSAAAVLAYHLFYHIQVRVSAWKDPFASYSEGGYQVAQSLFAIGTGSWFGMGQMCIRDRFVDEIHRLNRQVEEVLYPAMEDYAIDIMIGKGATARSIRLDLPKFTLVGATTRAGMLTAPLRDRFGVVNHLEFYTEQELKTIIMRSAQVLGVEIDGNGALELAKRSRGCLLYTSRCV